MTKTPTPLSPVAAFPVPDVGDILWRRFPVLPSLQPGSKSRPVIVLAVMDEVEPVRVRVVYGTSKKTRPVGFKQMVIDQKDRSAFAAAGLSYTTRFDFGQVLVLDYTDTWFALAPLAAGGTKPTPKLGQLHPTSMNDVARAAKEAGLIP